jgi:hypothetical protein
MPYQAEGPARAPRPLFRPLQALKVMSSQPLNPERRIVQTPTKVPQPCELEACVCRSGRQWSSSPARTARVAGWRGEAPPAPLALAPLGGPGCMGGELDLMDAISANLPSSRGEGSHDQRSPRSPTARVLKHHLRAESRAGARGVLLDSELCDAGGVARANDAVQGEGR